MTTFVGDLSSSNTGGSKSRVINYTDIPGELCTVLLEYITYINNMMTVLLEYIDILRKQVLSNF